MRNFFNTGPFYQIKQQNKEQLKIVICSCVYFFSLLCSYFILRPVRDEMGIVNGAVNMQWLFTGTFVAMLCIVPLFGLLVSKRPIKKVLLYSYSFFIGTILLFYVLFLGYGITRTWAIAFFIWLSVFNLFVVSLFWSFMADIFHGKSAKHYFGIIASGGSLGAITGPFIAKYLSSSQSIGPLLLTAILFLLIALGCIVAILGLIPDKDRFKKNRSEPKVKMTDLLEGIRDMAKSPYLLGIVAFILCYTAISTVLYFEQAHIVENTLKDSSERIAYFSNIDFSVNTIAVLGQFFLTARIIRKIGLSMVLASIPLCIGAGLIILGLNPALGFVAVLMVIHRAGNFMLLRPGREILYTVTSQREKYKAKNFIDTAIYRGGDALVGWIFAGLLALGSGLGTIAFLAIPVAFVWGFTGFRLGRLQQKKEKRLTLNTLGYESDVQP